MNIFFDHQTFSQQKYGGISRYFCELITGINKTKKHTAHLSLLWSDNAHLQEYHLSKLPYPFPSKNRLLQLSNQIFDIADCVSSRYDIYHATYFDDFLSKYIGTKPLVATFYDMTYERLSNQFVGLAQDTTITEQKKKIASKASHLIAISESTKSDMVELLNIAPERISVIYLGSSFMPDSPSVVRPLTVNAKPYLLYVGNRSAYKNFSGFLTASAGLLKRYKLALICAGGGAFSQDEINLIDTLSMNGQVEQREINDDTLPNLYRQAIAFVFPSFYEGFGIPVLEAFACNCPCVISNNSSLPEVAGDAALYIDPANPESIVHALDQIITDTTLRTDLIQRGQRRLNQFSWQNTVNQTIDLYERLL